MATQNYTFVYRLDQNDKRKGLLNQNKTKYQKYQKTIKQNKLKINSWLKTILFIERASYNLKNCKEYKDQTQSIGVGSGSVSCHRLWWSLVVPNVKCSRLICTLYFSPFTVSSVYYHVLFISFTVARRNRQIRANDIWERVITEMGAQLMLTPRFNT